MMTNKSDDTSTCTTASSHSKVVNCAITRTVLPPDYELDDYWMQGVVLKDEKDEESDFYSAYAYSSLYPLPDYLAKKIASAPPYDWYKHHSSTKKEPYSCNSVKDKEKKRTTKQNHLRGRKRERSFNTNSLSYSSSENEKKNKSVKDVSVLNNHCLKLSFKKQKNSHSWSLVNVTTAAASHRIEDDQNQRQFDHHQAHHSRKPSTRDQIVSAARVPSALMTRVPILPDQQELINNLITAKMGGCDHLMLVIQKEITASDINSQQNRFSIPFQQVLNDFLNSDEKKWLNNKETKNIDVNLLILNLQQQQPYLEEDKIHSVNFTKWDSNHMYVLNRSNWPIVVQQHKLEEHMHVQLWAFRLHSLLSFALVKT